MFSNLPHNVIYLIIAGTIVTGYVGYKFWFLMKQRKVKMIRPSRRESNDPESQTGREPGLDKPDMNDETEEAEADVYQPLTKNLEKYQKLLG